MRGWHLSCVNACKHVALTPDLMSQALSLKPSTKLESPKRPVPSPNQGHSTQPPSFSDPEFQIFSSSCMKSLNLPILLPQILQLHASIVSEVKISFFFFLREPSNSELLLPRMHTRISSFPMVKLLPSPFKAFLIAKSNNLPKPPSLSYSYLPLTFSLLSEYFSALALVISPVGSHWLLAPYNHVTKLIWWPKHLCIHFPSPKSKSYFLLAVGL